jgi:5'-3' exoribonuclease 2
MHAQGIAVKKNEQDDSELFDSNVITPGTEFMDQLAEYLRFLIFERQKNDPAWAMVKVILSDSQSPGEVGFLDLFCL